MLPNQVEQEPKEVVEATAGCVPAHVSAVVLDQIADGMLEPVDSGNCAAAASADLR